MARESQGLQVLLILFVMIAVALGVTTYLYCKQAGEGVKAVAAANQAKQQVETEKSALVEENKNLKTFIGYPDQSFDEIKKHFTEDMQVYGSEPKSADADPAKAGEKAFDAGTLYYSRLLSSMYKTIQDRSEEVIRSRNAVAELQTKYKLLESQGQDKIAEIAKSENDLSSRIKIITDDYVVDKTAVAAKVQDILEQEKKIRTDAAAAVSLVTAEKEAARKEAVAAEKARLDAVKTVNDMEKPVMDVPSGEITWVSVANKMVWINRGRADSLQKQTKFTVYSADSADAAKAVKKGTVEVTLIEGAHSAQARILDDKIADPIMAGDKIFTPLWSPGQQNHFALAGSMNLDGDGRNQLSVVRNLINQNGGAVDCELDDQGHKQGQITANTRCIVIGDAPDKGSAEVLKNYGDILRDAERYQLRKMTLSDFKQLMDYHKSSSVEHFGAGISSSGDVSRAATALKTNKAAPKAPAKAGGDESAP